MKKLTLLALTFLGSTALAANDQLGLGEAQNATRACIPNTSAQQTISTSTMNAQSTQMSMAVSAYIVCSVDTFVRWGSSAQTAVATDFLLPQKTMFPFFTGVQARHVAAILSSGTGYCRILECE